MSFIDMMANDVWSSADIDNKVRALIRSRYSSDDELKASRLARKTEPSDTEVAFVTNVDIWIASCVQQGSDARADTLLLSEVMLIEEAYRRLAIPAVRPEFDEEFVVINQEAIDTDIAQRADAQSVIDNASIEATALYDQRNQY